MNPQFLIAKLTANPSETAWSLAYSTLNFYVVLSVSASETDEKSIAQTGKELFERVQREYFSLDEKNLTNIKQAVQNAVETVPDTTYSLILATNVGNTLYIVTASQGSVLIKRGDKTGIIAKGEEGKVISFSGPLTSNDIIILQTQAFSEQIPTTILSENLSTPHINEISENLAPHLHEGASGAEAAILLQYIQPEQEPIETEEEYSDNDTDEEIKTEKHTEEKEEFSLEDVPKNESKRNMPSIKLPAVSIPSPTKIVTALRTNKKILLGIAIVVLVVFLIGSILTQSKRADQSQNREAIAQVVAAAKSDYDEGVALEPLNRPLALEKYTGAQKALNDAKQKYGDSDETAELDSLLSQVEQKLQEFSGGKKVENGEVMVKNTDAKLDAIQTVTLKDGKLVITDSSKNIAVITPDGSVDDTFPLESSAIIDSISDGNFAYILTNNSVLKVDLGNGDTDELFELEKARKSINFFGSNIYLLSADRRMVEKYSPSAYKATDYVTESAAISSTPVSFTIDGSIYVLLDNGTIKKFTRGAEEGFNLTGLQGQLSKGSLLYTDTDFSSLYILDPSNQRLLVVGKNGEVKQELSWDVFGRANDFAIDEQNKKAYIATKDALYTFGL